MEALEVTRKASAMVSPGEYRPPACRRPRGQPIRCLPSPQRKHVPGNEPPAERAALLPLVLQEKARPPASPRGRLACARLFVGVGVTKPLEL